MINNVTKELEHIKFENIENALMAKIPTEQAKTQMNYDVLVSDFALCDNNVFFTKSNDFYG
ncbi:MAG: hypothetical protein MZU97_09055 [Bacillus subtilis]|nr:hypothetical protein [Bacillus subtilis]